ncbi:MAG: FAD-dependent oxidoreductase [bacterium]
MKNFVIIGNSASGTAAADEIRKIDKSTNIVIVSDEQGPAYSRCLLTYYIMGRINRSQLTFRDAGFYKTHGIALNSGGRVVRIERKNKKVVLQNKDEVSYDKLLIATGAAAKVPPIFRDNENSSFTLRTIDDAEKIIMKLNKVDAAAVLGAGLIGMKIAHMLKENGKKVFVIARSNHILSQMLDAASAEFLTSLISNEAQILTGQDVQEAIWSGKTLTGLRLLNNNIINCGMVIAAKGVVPNTEIASEAGLSVNKGISVDETMKTSDKDIYAAGDAAETTDFFTGRKEIKGLWTTAVEQGRIAGKNMAGRHTVCNGAISMNSMECFGIPCISAGSLHDGCSCVQEYRNDVRKVLRRIFVQDSRIVGFVTIGDIQFAGMLNHLLQEKIDISSLQANLSSAKLSRADILKCIGEDEIISSMGTERGK